MAKIYNMTHDIDRHAGTGKEAIRWLSAEGKRKVLTYSELKVKSDGLAKALVEMGLKKGDRVMVLLPRLPEAYFSYMACLKAGLVVMPGSEMLRAGDIAYRLGHAQASAVIAHHHLADRVEEAEKQVTPLRVKIISGANRANWIPLSDLNGLASTPLPQTTEDDMAFLSYTSGTTGNPKGVIHHHSWAIAHQQTATEHWLDIRADDVVWATASPGWAKWIWSPFISTLGAGATAFVYHGTFDGEKYLQLLEKEKITVLCCTPTEYRIMAKQDRLAKYILHLRSAVSAGEPLNREVINVFRKYFNLCVRDGYGQTENTLLIATMKDMKEKPGSMGKPTPGNIVTIVDDDGKEVPEGEVGHIAVHRSSPALFKGYYQDPERTKQAFNGDWYLTGDRAKKDEDGYFWFEGRSDDIIISSGYTIGPFEVEDALVKHPAVKECAVVASPDEIRGSIVKAFVILRDPAWASDELVLELQEHVKKTTAPYKYPREIEFVDNLPKTASGKIRRVELRDLEFQRKKALS
ncbi:acyl-CoA synthetase [Thermoactinomyces mirandus]|uniref:Acyl--CoA ligase n=1 Tax=Thermoactinomyces mirandus TaxID=2756294 RepID=A0A7W2ARA5_9BACL|nr:acyl--CoA ligase [Thermoactinomyces mirandus]MBA4601370.1 acyl--CoA ligase [Thermoactinomyces mirandus]